MKFPIGIQDFKVLREEGFVYVDKTALLYQMANEGAIYFLSRPRRFGKSLLVSTLKYYFDGARDLFEGLAVETLEKDWVRYPIFHIDFNSTNFTKSADALPQLINGMVEDWERQYGYVGNPDFDYGKRFAELMKFVHETTGRRCVVLVDEYEKPLLDVLDSGMTVANCGKDMLVEEVNREILKGFYSAFKAASQDLRFVLLTGVTKFSQVSVFSGFNQPENISMSEQFDAICGITKDELEEVFHDEINAMAEEMEMTSEDVRQMLKRYYDGYHFSKRMNDIFNPFSLLNALKSRSIQDYWFSTGTPTYLIRLLNHTNENLNELTGKYYDMSEFIDYKADMERPLPMIYQSGYLTIKDYDRETRSYLLDLPNNEVKKGFLTLIASNYLGTKESAGTLAIQLARAILKEDLDAWRKNLTAFFASIPYTMRRKDTEMERERYFHYTFYLIFRILGTYLVLTEKQQSEGRADCIIETGNGVYIFEFKLDGSADEALRKIEDKGYARPYMAEGRKVHKVGVSFSSMTGTIEDWKEA